MVKRSKIKKMDSRAILFDSPQDRSMTSTFSIAIYEFKKAGLLALFKDVLAKVADTKSREYRLLNTYIDDLETKDIGPSIGLSTAHETEPKGYKVYVVELDDLDTIRQFAKPFKRELSKAVLNKFGSYLKFAEAAKIKPSNVSKFFTQQKDAKPRLATMRKFIEHLGIEELEIKIYPENLQE
jgi:hypothetical protein